MTNTTTLSTLIERHRAASARYLRAIRAEDAFRLDDESPEAEAAMDERAAATAEEEAATHALLSYRCADMDEAAERARYMVGDPDILDALSEGDLAREYLGSFFEPGVEIVG